MHRFTPPPSPFKSPFGTASSVRTGFKNAFDGSRFGKPHPFGHAVSDAFANYAKQSQLYARQTPAIPKFVPKTAVSPIQLKPHFKAATEQLKEMARHQREIKKGLRTTGGALKGTLPASTRKLDTLRRKVADAGKHAAVLHDAMKGTHAALNNLKKSNDAQSIRTAQLEFQRAAERLRTLQRSQATWLSRVGRSVGKFFGINPTPTPAVVSPKKSALVNRPKPTKPRRVETISVKDKRGSGRTRSGTSNAQRPQRGAQERYWEDDSETGGPDGMSGRGRKPDEEPDPTFLHRMNPGVRDGILRQRARDLPGRPAPADQNSERPRVPVLRLNPGARGPRVDRQGLRDEVDRLDRQQEAEASIDRYEDQLAQLEDTLIDPRTRTAHASMTRPHPRRVGPTASPGSRRHQAALRRAIAKVRVGLRGDGPPNTDIQEAIEAIVSGIPIIGDFVTLGDVAAGVSITGRDLTAGERIIEALGLLVMCIPVAGRILRIATGPLRAEARAAIRTAEAASRYSEVLRAVRRAEPELRVLASFEPRARQLNEALTRINTGRATASDRALAEELAESIGRARAGGQTIRRATGRAAFIPLTGPLTRADKDLIRTEAREIAESVLARRLPAGSDVHHRIPLQFAHLFPELNPNRIENLIVITDRQARDARQLSYHGRAHDLWTAHIDDLRANGMTPTRADIESIAEQIDAHMLDTFGGRVRFLGEGR